MSEENQENITQENQPEQAEQPEQENQVIPKEKTPEAKQPSIKDLLGTAKKIDDRVQADTKERLLNQLTGNTKTKRRKAKNNK